MRAAAKAIWSSPFSNVNANTSDRYSAGSATPPCSTTTRDTIEATSRLWVLVGPVARCSLEEKSDESEPCTIDA